ncbi:MAG: hypothetical protein IPG22_16555 [Acidobacteria bacterium]|nr:hypothetical protein [Acidobacteriota bacterium]
MISLDDMDRILSRPGFTGAGDEGFELSTSDEKALDKAWREVAEEDGVVQLPDQPTADEIRNFTN